MSKDRRCLYKVGSRWGVRKRLPRHYKEFEHKRVIGTLDAARKYRDYIEQRILYRQSLHEELERDNQPTIAEILDIVAGGWKPRDPRHSYIPDWKKWAGDMRPSDVTRIQIQVTLDKLAERFSGNTVRLISTILRAVFVYAVENDLIEDGKNPFRKKFRMPALGKNRGAWTPEQAQRIIAALGQYGPMFIFTLLTGCRASEMLDLTWEFVDLDNSYLEFMEPKQGENHRVPISEPLRRLLLEQKNLRHSHVFPQEHEGVLRPWVYKRFNDYWRGVFDSLGYPGRKNCWHKARHSTATWAANSGASIWAVSGLLGHSSSAITEDIYAHEKLGL